MDPTRPALLQDRFQPAPRAAPDAGWDGNCKYRVVRCPAVSSLTRIGDSRMARRIIHPADQGPSAVAVRAARRASPWLERIARFGYAARGVVYLLVGYVAVRAALSPAGGGPTDSGGALRIMDDGSAERVLLAVVSAGLFGFALWRFLQAAFAPEQRKGGIKAAIKRVSRGVSGLIYLGLGLEAARLVLRSGTRSSPDQAQHWSNVAMQYQWGRWLVLAAGLIVAAVAVREIARAMGSDFGKRLHFHDVSMDVRRNVERLGRFGTASRGVVFGIVAWFLFQAALQYDAGEVRGFGGALRALQQRNYGPVLLGIVALGLVGFGVWQLAEARYRRIQPT